MTAERPAAAVLLRRESGLLVQRLRLWTPARYAAAAAPWGTRGDLVHHLAQYLADLAAAAEGTARRRLPRLDSDLVLPDQLAVTADDLLCDEIPSGLAAALGVDDVVAAGLKACNRR